MKILENLALDKWFKAVTYIGGLLLFFSIFVPSQVVTNNLITIFGIGMFVFGVGRWKNYKTTSSIQGNSVVKVTQRDTDMFGIILETVGILILLHGTFIVLTEYTAVGHLI
jgi:hypothetical protein